VNLTLRHAALATMALTLAACYPDDINSADDLDTVTTLFNQQQDFGAIGTYVVLDTVVFIDGDGEGGDEESSISHAYDDQVLAAVRRNLDAAGYTELADPAAGPPDITVLASTTSSTTVGVAYDWWYYYGYYPYWPGYGYGAGWGYGYPPVSVAYAYTTGTLLLTMIDAKNADIVGKKIPVIWLGAVNGVLTGTVQVSRVTDGIDQAFAQSPYLRAR
jgi:hypothetical protein